ncbi:MAG: EpsI family protein, partial [Planctomycetes bacterium]|nr:EpsI family protein [Planctomycetota bacterium]
MPNGRAVVAAALVASVIILVCGSAYRVMAARLNGPVNTLPISQAALDQFPMQVDDWQGTDVAMDEAIIRETDTDARINRRYSRHGGLEVVSFYVASGVKARDLMPHRPEVCYAGAGWTRLDRRFLEVPLSDGSTLPCNVLVFSRGALNTQRVTVLDYYIVDGQYCHDVSLLRYKVWRGSEGVRYVAQVQITASTEDTGTPEGAERMVGGF